MDEIKLFTLLERFVCSQEKLLEEFARTNERNLLLLERLTHTYEIRMGIDERWDAIKQRALLPEEIRMLELETVCARIRSDHGYVMKDKSRAG